MSDLITLIDNEVPMDMYSALKDIEKQTPKVMDSAFGVENLSSLALINASGKVLNSLQKSCRTGQKGSSSSYLIAVSTRSFFHQAEQVFISVVSEASASEF